MAHDEHRALRRDVRLLAGTLGRVLAEQGGPGLLEDVERVRLAARAARARGGEEDRAALREAVRSLPLDEQASALRAFGLYFQLANLAEQHHRLRRRAEEAQAERPPRESLADAFARLEGAGASAEDIRRGVEHVRLRLVLTAHPTE